MSRKKTRRHFSKNATRNPQLGVVFLFYYGFFFLYGCNLIGLFFFLFYIIYIIIYSIYTYKYIIINRLQNTSTQRKTKINKSCGLQVAFSKVQPTFPNYATCNLANLLIFNIELPVHKRLHVFVKRLDV